MKCSIGFGIVVILIVSSYASGQDEELEKQVMTIELDGKLVRAVPDEISIEYAIQRALTRGRVDFLRQSGEVAALELPLSQIDRIQTRFEFTPDQIDSLAEVKGKFAAEVAALDVPDTARVNKIKLKYCDEVKTIFLPGQLAAFARMFDLRVRILSMLVEEDNITGVDLSPEQRREIQEAGQAMREPLESILKRHEKELAEYRLKVKEVFDRVVTEEQKEKIKKNWRDPDHYMSVMDLKQIFEDVSAIK